MENKVISSLSEYLEVLKNNDKGIRYYRGESKKQEKIQASGFRVKDLDITDEVPYLTMIENYKKEVWNRISNEDREHFIAFSQHHGVPTNLIDITENPLVSLYFACENTQNEIGYVYLFKNNGIDVTNLIKGNSVTNLLKSLTVNERVFQGFGKLMQEFIKDNEKIFYELLINSIIELKNFQRVDTDMNALEKLVEKAKEFSKNPIDHYEFLTKPINKKRIEGYGNYDGLVKFAFKILEDKIPEVKIVDSDDTKLISIYLNIVLCIIDYIDFYGSIDDIGCLPKMFYAPIMNFNRGNNQQGLFLYQAHLTHVKHWFGILNEKKLFKQKIVSDDILIIENKAEILRELDNININRKFLFNDYDNIAEYIKVKYIENNKTISNIEN